MKKRTLGWILLIAGMLFCRSGYLEGVFYNIDEAEYAVAAQALDHGWLPGVDLLGSTKPPGIALLYNLLFHLFGSSPAVLHLAHLLIMIGMGMLVVELAIALFGDDAAIPGAALFWMVSNSFELPGEILALNVESPAMLLVMAALVLLFRKGRAWWPALLAGLLLGAAAMFRQSAAVFVLPAAVAILFSPERRVRNLALAAGGFALAWAPLLIWYGPGGRLDWAWDSWVRYPLEYSRDAGWSGFLAGLWYSGTNFALEAAAPLGMMIGGLVLLKRERFSKRAVFIFVFVAAALAAVFSGSRFFGHYYIQLFPAAALAGVAAWLHLAQGSVKAKRVLGAAVIFGELWAAGHFPLWRSYDQYAIPRGMGHYALGQDELELKIGEFARTNTTPDETITVWGYCPQIYFYAERRPGTRDYLCHYTTGYSPGTFDPTQERAVREKGHRYARQMFLADLEQRKPKYIFDLVQVQDYEFTFIQYSLNDYLDLADYMKTNYLPEGEIGDARIYRRRTPADTWWPEDLPKPHP